MEYKVLAELYETLASSSKRLYKTYAISQFLKQKQDLQETLLLIRGKVFPDWDERKVGLAERTVVKAITLATGIDSAKIEKLWSKTGDLGKVAEEYTGKKQQSTLFSQSLTVHKVFTNLQNLATLEGLGTVGKKTQLVAELLTQASPLEAKYIVRTVLEDLRIGIGDGTLRDAIGWAYLVDPHFDEKTLQITPDSREEYAQAMDTIQSAFDKCNDWSQVAEAAKYGPEQLQNIKMRPGVPVKVMLAQRVNTIEDGFAKVGKPAAIEYKYDGFRMLVNKNKEKITIFTRRLENVTKQFPDVIEYVQKHVKGDTFILDGEAVGFDPQTKKFLPFQHVSQRIKRKYDIDTIKKSLPVELHVFDILYYEGKTYIQEPFMARRKQLENAVTESPGEIRLAEQLVTENEEEVASFNTKSLAAGNEGIMFKNLEGIYKPGSRVGYMVKLKPERDTFDLVIVKAEYGEGKRSRWLASFTVACRDEDDNLYELGKVGTGIKELEAAEGLTFGKLTELLKPLILSQKGKEVEVRPEIVLEVAYEEIQRSPTYSSGWALRFPRVVQLREDRGIMDITTLDELKEASSAQTK